jgi:hypothetical protein
MALHPIRSPHIIDNGECIGCCHFVKPTSMHNDLDGALLHRQNDRMKTTKKHLIAPEILAELEAVLQDAYAAPDKAEMAKACKQIDRMRQETRKKTGDLDVAVDLVRDARK